MDNFEDAYYEICAELPDGVHVVNMAWDRETAIRLANEEKDFNEKDGYPDTPIYVLKYEYVGEVYRI